MNITSNPKRLPAAFLAGSLFCMLLVASLTSPVSNVGYAMVFFFALMVFLISSGYLIVLLHGEKVSPKSRYRIFIISLFLTLILMFRSAGALSWLDGIALGLITLGLLFYGNRRV